MTNIAKTDIDIDTKDRTTLLNLIKHTPASIIKNNETKKHNTGVYVTDIPVNPFTNTSSIDYQEAEERGYFKLDILNVSVYEEVKNEKHLVELVSKEPDWGLLELKPVVENLFHIHDHFDIVSQLKPKSIIELAEVLAIIRPAKRHLLTADINIRKSQVWQKPTDGGYYFKKSHAVGYAMAIVLQLNLLSEQAQKN